jgi:hypothetical protein
VVPPLTGYVSVDHSARLIRNYRYSVERAMRALGGWIALTPDVSAKLLMGRHVWDLAQHADAFGKRLPELRAPAQVSEAANERVVTFMDALEEPEGPHQTVERLVGVYRVLKPHLRASYHDYLLRANTVYEPPTRRILLRCIDDERRHIAAGETILSHLCATPALTERALAWQRRLEGPTMGWQVPEDLREALGALGDSLLARNRGTIARWLAAGVSPDPVCEALGAATLASHRLVAVARLGHQRLVKWRLEGPDVSVTVLSRWAPGPEGWRVVMLDVARIEAPGPAHSRP